MSVKSTSLLKQHEAMNAKIVEFAGWQMPLYYGSQLQEHHFVRQDAGTFDVSHMGIVDITGKDACDYLRWLLANDVAKLKVKGKALYSCMLNENGGIVDDLIVYKLGDDRYRLVVNAATFNKDFNWLKKNSLKYHVEIQAHQDLSIIAVQGPSAIAKTALLFSPEQQIIIRELKPFTGYQWGHWFIARTGYTGEDGLEIQLPQDEAPKFWEKLIEIGIKPCGLGARDTLRLEAGLNLYGTDMDENTTPLESNLSWTVAFEPNERSFIGREALEEQYKQGVKQQLVGLVLEAAGVLRGHQKVFIKNDGEGETTSGTFSPTLGYAIALARVPIEAKGECLVEIRQKKIPARIVKLPFVRHGKKVFE